MWLLVFTFPSQKNHFYDFLGLRCVVNNVRVLWVVAGVLLKYLVASELLRCSGRFLGCFYMVARVFWGLITQIPSKIRHLYNFLSIRYEIYNLGFCGWLLGQC